MAAILLLAGSLVPAAPGEAGLKRFEYQQILMGVPVKIVVYSAARIARKRRRPCRLRPHSPAQPDLQRLRRRQRNLPPVSHVGAGPARCRVSPELAIVLADSLELSRRSEGAFDVTVGPLVNLWRKARRTKQLPTPQALAAAESARRLPVRSARRRPARSNCSSRTCGSTSAASSKATRPTRRGPC